MQHDKTLIIIPSADLRRAQDLPYVLQSLSSVQQEGAHDRGSRRPFGHPEHSHHVAVGHDEKRLARMPGDGVPLSHGVTERHARAGEAAILCLQRHWRSTDESDIKLAFTFVYLKPHEKVQYQLP